MLFENSYVGHISQKYNLWFLMPVSTLAVTDRNTHSSNNGPHLSKVRTPNFQRTPKTTVTLRFINMDVGVRHAQILHQLRRWCTHVLS